MILSSVAAAILRPWARRALQAENKRLRDDNDKLHGQLGGIVNRLVTANATIADLQVEADRDKRSAARLLAGTRAALERQIANLQERLDSNAVTADNQRLAKELTAVKAEQLACRTGLCDWANDLRGQLKATVAELHRERRLRDQHEANCATATAIQDHVDDKNRENAS